MRLPVSLNEVASGLLLLAVLGFIGLIFAMIRQPAPYNYLYSTLVTSGTTLCPGQKFHYEVSLKVVRAPVTIWRSEYFFSAEGNPQNKWADHADDIEYFSWNSKMNGTLPIKNDVVFPVRNINGGFMGAGKYDYTVNLNTSGLATPASLTFPVEVPASCFK